MVMLWLMDGQRCVPLKLPDMSSLDASTRLLPAGFYTTFRTYNSRSRALGLRSHLDRLYGPARRLGIEPILDRITLRTQLAGLLAGFPSPEARVRLVLAARADPGSIFVLIEPLKVPLARVYSRGVKVITTSTHRDLPALKSTDFIEQSQQVRRHIASSRVYEGLIAKNGRLLEGLTSNFFYVTGGTLGTARRDVLNGVTRRLVLHLAQEQGMLTVFNSLKLSQISEIDEAFLTSSSRGIVPIITIDAQKVGSGRVGEWTNKLMKAYNREIGQRAEKILPAKVHYSAAK